MDTLENLKAFIDTAKTGSFVGAARRAGVSPSVMTKRINQLEHRVKVRLFDRSTRKVSLTEAGQRYLPRIERLIDELEQTLDAMAQPHADLDGHLRIKAPTALTVLYLGRVFSAFRRSHPRLSMEIILMDHAVNPIEHGFDIALGARETSYGRVIDVPLCALRNMVCATPDYLRRRGRPKHPNELVQHDCLNFQPSGPNWQFRAGRHTLSIEVQSKLASNDRQVLLSAALEGNGLALLADYIALPSIRSGELVQVLEDFPIPEHWLKALIPESHMRAAPVVALVDYLKAQLSEHRPWEMVPSDG